MYPKHTKFVLAWELSPTLEVAAAVLGMKVRSVTRQANRMRAQGIKLKALTDVRFNRHIKRDKDVPLTAPQQQFVEVNYKLALAAAWRTCRALDVGRHRIEDLAHDAAVNALIQVGRRSTKPGFVAESVVGLIYTVVRRQVYQLLKSYFGAPSQKKLPDLATHDLPDGAVDPKSPRPAEEAIRQEEEAIQGPQTEKAIQLMGESQDTSKRKRSREAQELLTLRSKARELGLATTGTADELIQRIADYIRVKLGLTPAPTEPVENPIPERIRERMTQVDPAPSPEQVYAEKFVTAWETSLSAAEAARTLGCSVENAMGYAAYLRSLGVELKTLPIDLAHVVQSILRLRPSRN